MNRAYLIVLIPGALVAAGYIVVLRYLGLQVNYTRLSFAAIGFVAAVIAVRLYRRRKARASGS